MIILMVFMITTYHEHPVTLVIIFSETGVYWHRVCGSDEKHLMIKEKESKVYTTLATYYKLR